MYNMGGNQFQHHPSNSSDRAYQLITLLVQIYSLLLNAKLLLESPAKQVSHLFQISVQLLFGQSSRFSFYLIVITLHNLVFARLFITLTEGMALDLGTEISYFPEILTKVNQTCLTYL